MQEQNNLDIFVSELLQASGKVDEPTVHSELLENVNSYIDRALLESLPGDKLDAIEDAINNGTITEEMVTSALADSEIDATAVITEALEKFRDEYLGEAKQ